MFRRSATPAVSPEGFLPGSSMDRRDARDQNTRALLNTYDAKARTVEAVLSAGTRVRRWGVFEELEISPEAVDVTRVAAGQVKLLDSHRQDSTDCILGSIIAVRFENGLLIGTITFADTEAGREAERRVASGEISGLSVGYRVTKWLLVASENDIEIWRAAAWELLEASLVSVPADPAASFRSADLVAPTPKPMETDDMRRNAPAGDTPAPVPVTEPVVETRAVPTAEANVAAALTAERARVRDLGDIATRSGLGRDVLDAAISDGTTVEAFRARAFEHLAAASNATRTGNVATSQITADGRDKYVEGATRALLLRAGIAGAGERNEFSGMSLARLAEESIRVAGGRVRNFGLQMVGEAFTLGRAGGAHSSGDFPLILENVANKSMLAGWETADTTYQIWTKKGSLSDFKIAHRYGVGPLPMLKRRPEGAKYEYASFGENKASVMLATYGQMFAVTRELIINDDLSAISDIPAKQGRAARLTVDSLPYALITANAPWQGGAALFHATRKNLAQAAAAPSAASFEAAAKAMRTGHNAGSDGKTRLRIAPKFGLFPEAMRFDVNQLLVSGTALGQDNPAIPNPVKGFIDPVFSDWLDDDSDAAWYFAADKMNDTVEVSFLDGVDSPFLDQQQGWQIDGTEFKVRIDVGASVLDPRGLYKNAGAA